MDKHHVIAAFALVFTLAGGRGVSAGPLPVIPESRPDRDTIAAMCPGPRAVYAHAWHAQRIMIFGTVYKDGKHDPPYVVITWGADKKPNAVWHNGVQVPDATKWLEETDLCEFAGASNP